MNTTVLEYGWLRFRTYHHVYHGVLGALSVAFNVFVARIIITRTPNAIIQYSRILFLSCLVNIGVAGYLFLDHNIMIITKDGLFLIPNGFFRDAPPPLLYCLQTLHSFFFSLTLAMIPLPFVYRYFYICRNKILTNFEIFQLAIACYLPSFLYALVTTFSRTSMEESDRYFENYHEFQWLDPENDEIILVQKPNSREFKTVLASLTILLIILYGTVIICSWLIYKRLYAAKRFKKTLKYHIQVTRTLTFQAITPVVFMLGPILISILCLVLRRGNIGISILITAIVEFYPIADPLGILLFVKPYKNAIFKTGKQQKVMKSSEMIEEPPDSQLTSSV